MRRLCLKLLLDTNVLVYDTVEDSEHHGEATEIIDRAKEVYILYRGSRVHMGYAQAYSDPPSTSPS